MSDQLRWTVLVPMRALPSAKSRLARGVPPELHAEVVQAMRTDTLAAARACPEVARVIVVSDAAGAAPDSSDIELVQTTPGLNGALRDGADHAHRQWPEDGVAALVGDLPALRTNQLSDALRQAATVARAFAADTAGTGTTLLTARPGFELQPEFGLQSASRHAVGATALDVAAALRHDVDTRADLDASATLGVGPATTAVLRRL